MKKAENIVSKSLAPEQENIPILTDVVTDQASRGKKKSVHTDKKTQKKSARTSNTSGKIGNIDRKQLEKLIYKKLHQSLPQVCQQLADEIIAELDSKTESGSD
jgi:hypothetical protein